MPTFPNQPGHNHRFSHPVSIEYFEPVSRRSALTVDPSVEAAAESVRQSTARRRRTALSLATAGVFAISATALAGSRAQESSPDATTSQISADDDRTVDPFSTNPADDAAQADDPFADDAPSAATPANSAAAPGDAVEGTVDYDPAADTVEIHVSGANVVDVLRMLASQSERNIIASPQVSGVVTCNLYDVTVQEALDAILKGNGLASREEGSFIYVYTQEQVDEMEQANRQMETRVFRLFHTLPGMAARMVEPALSESAVVSFTDEAQSGMASSPDDGGGMTFGGSDVLVIRDYPDNLDRVQELMDEVDRRPEQVLIEATILSTTLTESNQLGVDFNLVGGVDLNQVNFLPGGQVSSGDVAGGTAGLGNDVYGGGTGNNFAGQVPGGMKVGFVSGDVSVFLSALEGVTDTTVLANPKVLAVNKQKGEVLVGREDGYLTTTLTETAATQSVEFLKTGTRLVFRPFVSRDGFVRLEVHPEDSAGNVNDSGLPSKVTTEVTTNVLVKDGHTIVIGGLFRESSVVNKSQVPVLGNIPLLGRLFGRQADNTVREEIIILLTPHIIKDLDRYGELSETELRRAEKLRVGTRKGMMFWGRNRMAQSYYEKAVAELAKDRPNRGRARFYLNASLQNDPSFVEAIELKEQLTREVVVEADGSTVRSFLRRAVREDVARSPVPTDSETDGPDNDPVVPETRDRLDGPVRPGNRSQTTRPANNVAVTAPSTRPEFAETDADPIAD